MVRPFMFALLLFLCSSPCFAQQNKVPMPQSGLWQATMQGSEEEANRTEFTIRSVINDTSSFEVVFDFGKQETLFSTVMSGVLDRSTGDIRLHWRETHTNLPVFAIRGGAGTVKGELVGGNAATLRLHFDDGQVADAIWVGTEPLQWRGAFVPASRSDTELNQILSEWSGDFEVNDTRVLHGNDKFIVDSLAGSPDDTVRVLAISKKHIMQISEIELPEIRQLVSRYRDEVQQEGTAAMFGLGPLDTLGLMFSPAISLRANAIIRQVNLHVIRADAIAKFMPNLEKTLVARRGDRELIASAFEYRFVSDGEKEIELYVKNVSGRAVHNAFVYTVIEVDQEKFSAYRAEYVKSRKNLFALHFVTGAPVEDSHEALLHFYSLPHYNTAFLSSWNDGDTLKISLPDPELIETIGKSAKFWVSADQGYSSKDLQIDHVVTMLNQIRNREPK